MQLSFCLRNIRVSAKMRKRRINVRDKKICSLVIFAIALLYSIAATRTISWLVEKYDIDLPMYIKLICYALVLGPLYWATYRFMDEFQKPKK